MNKEERELQRLRQEEIKRKRAEDSFESLRNRTLGAAAVIGTSAAYLHRSGRYAKNIGKLSKFVRTFRKTLQDTAITSKDKVTISDFKKFSNVWKENAKVIGSDIEDGRIKLNKKNQQSYFSSLITLEAASRSPGRLAEKAWKQDVVTTGYKRVDAFMKSLEKDNINLKRRYENYVNDVVHHLDNPDEIVSLRKTYKVSDDELPLIQEIERDMQKHFADDERKLSIYQKVRDDINKLKRRDVNIDALEREYGTVDTSRRSRSWAERVTGSRGITIGEILANRHRFANTRYELRSNQGSTADSVDVLTLLARKADQVRRSHTAEEYERFLKITPDARNLRASATGDFYSNEVYETLKDDAIRSLAYTMPGKIAKLGDIYQDRIAPRFAMFHKGEINPQAALANSERNDLGRLDRTMYYSDGEVFLSDGDGLTAYAGDELKHIKLASGSYGSRRKLLRSMYGLDRYHEETNPLAKELDLWQEKEVYRGSILEKAKSVFAKKDEDSLSNVLARQVEFTDEMKAGESAVAELSAGDSERAQEAVTHIEKRFEDIKTVYNILKKNVRGMSGETIEALDGKLNPTAQNLLDILKQEDAESMMEGIRWAVEADTNKTLSKEFSNILAKARNNPTGVFHKAQRKNTQDNVTITSSIIDFFGESTREKEVVNYEDLLREALTKEIISVQNSAAQTERETVLGIIEGMNLSTKEKVNLRTVSALSHLDTNTALGEEAIQQGLMPSEKLGVIKQFDNLVQNKENSESENLRNTFIRFSNEYQNRNARGAIDSVDLIAEGEELSEWVIQQKTANPLNLIKSMNEAIKNGDGFDRFFSQIFAGRGRPENISDLTLTPYFFLHRLNEIGSMVNVGLSNDSMGSTYQLAKGILLKRALPATIGMTYYDWADDTSQEITGRSFSGAVAEGAADMDIAGRRVMDAIGLTGVLKDQYAINPIMQYWGEGTTFRNADELEDYYTRGYTAVRKGAWWTFGSVNEARGGEIQYWQPTFMRRIQSDYKDKALYDGYADKWSHSWIPVPSAPWGPALALADPYWLEEKHAEDRPYPVSGNMFEDNTPWGAVLNNTVGALIKPQKELHSFRLRGGTDIKANLYALNEAIKQKARDAFNLNEFKIRNDQLVPVNVYSYSSMTSSPFFGGSMQGAGIPASNPNATYFNTESGEFEALPQKEPNNGFMGTGIATFGNGTGATLGTNAELPSNVHYAVMDETNAAALLKRFNDDKSFVSEDADGNLAMYTSHNIHNELDIRDPVMDFVYEAGVGKINSITNAYLGIKPYSGITTAYNAAKGVVRDLVYITPYSKIQKFENPNDKTVEVKMRNVTGDDSEYVITPDKLKNYRPSQAMELLDNPDAVTDLLNQAKGGDLVKQSAKSARLIAGIYGYASGEVTGLGTDQEKRLSTAQDMTSNSRGFWDENYGGAGGSLMEIVRRFIPDYRRNARVNPLMNTMPDWLPERFRFGDPYTLVPKGEMRLPGEGYESLNALHPDAFGAYGAFDRFKILADIAPFTEEYKIWREIAQKTIQDPDLKEEMQEIKDRVARQGKKHEFYDYKILGSNLEYQDVVISSIDKYGKFRAGDQTFKLAGVNVTANGDESMEDVLGRYIHPGMIVTVAVDANDALRTNKDTVGSINAAVFVDGENIAQQMLEDGAAKEKRNDTSAPAILATYGEIQKAVAGASEFIAHLDIPFLSDQYLRVRSPLESYKAEQVYGTPYQSWEHPIDTFFAPAITRAVHDFSALNVGFNLAHNWFEKYSLEKGLGTFDKRLGHSMYLLTNRGAFVGGALSLLVGKPSMRLAHATNAIVEAGHLAVGGNGIFDNALIGADLGVKAATFLEKQKGLGAVIGAGVGIAMNMLSDHKGGEWIPEKTQEKWNADEYFDRLTYIKYQGLYHEAARRALDEEGVDVEEYVEYLKEHREKNDADLTYLKSMKKSLAQKAGGTSIYADLMSDINKKLNAVLADKPDDIVGGGKWTQAALLYKQAADNTVEGLTDKSTWSELITALPTNEREYFTEFVKVRDPDKRNEILRTSSQSLRHALEIAWHMSSYRQTNEEYFMNHALPDEDWEGWDPNVDLKDIQVKTIENEGMNLADFGFYSSQLEKDSVVAARPLTTKEVSQKSSEVKDRLKRAMQGKGIQDIDISVEPGPPGGITQVTANIVRWATNRDTIEQRKKLRERIEREL